MREGGERDRERGRGKERVREGGGRDREREGGGRDREREGGGGRGEGGEREHKQLDNSNCTTIDQDITIPSHTKIIHN